MKIIKVAIAKTAMPMKTKADIPEGYGVRVSPFRGGGADFQLIHKAGQGGRLGHIALFTTKDPEILCTGTYGAEHGWGPYMYDVAIRYATEKGKHVMSQGEAKKRGIFADWGATSDSAQAVWDHYRDKREDVEETEKGFRFRDEVAEEETEGEGEEVFAKSFKIIKVAMNYGYGCWISPDGEIFNVEQAEHALESIVLTKEFYPELWDEDEYYIGEFSDSPHGSMLDLLTNGWVHVRYEPLNIGYKGSLSLPAKKALFKIINMDEEDHVFVSDGVNDTRRPVSKLDARRFIQGVL